MQAVRADDHNVFVCFLVAQHIADCSRRVQGGQRLTFFGFGPHERHTNTYTQRFISFRGRYQRKKLPLCDQRSRTFLKQDNRKTRQRKCFVIGKVLQQFLLRQESVMSQRQAECIPGTDLLSWGNFTCSHTVVETANQTCRLSKSHRTDNRSTRPRIDPKTPGDRYDRHESTNFLTYL